MMSDTKTFNVILTTADEEERDRIYELLERAKAGSDKKPEGATIVSVDKFDELGAVETFFLIGMGVSVPVTAGGIWVWWDKHNGKRVPLESKDGQDIVKAVKPGTEKPKSA